jgi:hypothetical protein
MNSVATNIGSHQQAQPAEDKPSRVIFIQVWYLKGELLNNKHVANQYKRNRHHTPIQNKTSLNSSSNADAVLVIRC